MGRKLRNVIASEPQGERGEHISVQTRGIAASSDGHRSPRNDNTLITCKPLQWTEHAKYKMRQYGLSPVRVNRVLRFPTRTEKGIAPKTVAVMQTTTSKKRHEIWVMYQDTKLARKVIAA